MYISEKIKEYGDIPKAEMFAIGGTATTLAAIDLNLKIYNPLLINGHKISIENIYNIKEKLFNVTDEERKEINGVEPARAEVIGGGSLLMFKIMEMLNLTYITVSEDDNLEGYLLSREEL